MSIKIVYVPQFEVTFGFKLIMLLRKCANMHYDHTIKSMAAEAGTGPRNGLLTMIWHALIWMDDSSIPMENRSITWTLTWADADHLLKCMEVQSFLRLCRFNSAVLAGFENALRKAMSESMEKTNEHS